MMYSPVMGSIRSDPLSAGSRFKIRSAGLVVSAVNRATGVHTPVNALKSSSIWLIKRYRVPQRQVKSWETDISQTVGGAKRDRGGEKSARRPEVEYKVD